MPIKSNDYLEPDAVWTPPEGLRENDKLRLTDLAYASRVVFDPKQWKQDS